MSEFSAENCAEKMIYEFRLLLGARIAWRMHNTKAVRDLEIVSHHYYFIVFNLFVCIRLRCHSSRQRCKLYQMPMHEQLNNEPQQQNHISFDWAHSVCIIECSRISRSKIMCMNHINLDLPFIKWILFDLTFHKEMSFPFTQSAQYKLIKFIHFRGLSSQTLISFPFIFG